MGTYASFAAGFVPNGSAESAAGIDPRNGQASARSAVPSPVAGFGLAATSPAPRPARALDGCFTERGRDRPGDTRGNAPAITVPVHAVLRVGDGLCPILGSIAAAVALGLAFLAS